MLRKLTLILLLQALLLGFLLPVRGLEPAQTDPAETEPVQTDPAQTDPAETAPTETTEETAWTEERETVPEPPEPEPRPYGLYFGLLHAHTDLSDGLGTVEEAFAHAAQVEGLDFFAVTDHSNSFDNADSGGIALDGSAVSGEWAAGKAAAAAVTDASFVGIFGYEMTWQEGKHLGHLNTFNTPGWESRNQPAYENQPTALETYYRALTTVPQSISQFNHPGAFYGEFENFAHYSAEYDAVIHLLEVGGEGDFTAYDHYTKALDAGWHVAPSTSQNNHNGLWGDADEKRTVILAEELTEQSLFDAIRSHRVYATEDRDLRIWYEMDRYSMGSVLPGGDTREITVELEDPTDAAIGTVEVITGGGAVADSCTVSGKCETVSFSVPGDAAYYYIRVTQPDADVAVTAPVWLERYEDLGISGFSADTSLPVQGKELALTVELYNSEKIELPLHSAQLMVGGQTVYTQTDPGTVKPGETLSLTLPYTHPDAGRAEITVVVAGTVAGENRIWEESLTLYFRSGELVSGLLADGSHGNAGLEQLENFKALAAQADMAVTVFTGEMPRGGELLLVTAPATAFEDGFVSCAAEFLRQGGSLIVTGGVGGSPQLNRLLKAAGCTMRLNADLAADEVSNGGTPDALFPTTFNRSSKWCEALTAEQFYSHHSGCTVDPGSGTWLVKNGSDVLLACEDTAYGGTIFASGCLFLSDAEMPQPQNPWDPPRANRTIAGAILGAEQRVLPRTDIEMVRVGQEGDIYRVTGYVTAGTANKYNTFPDTVYLQDDTGGVAVTDITDTGIQVGAPMELIGTLHWNDAVPELQLMEYRILEEDYHRYSPRVMANKTAMDYASHGGQLLKIRGKVTALEKTADGKGITRLVLKDTRGQEAVVEIEAEIRSGATGKNTLAKDIKKGSTVEAMGLLHINGEGETVLRVRNCDEVVYVPTEADPSNPDTGDWLARIWKGAVAQ